MILIIKLLRLIIYEMINKRSGIYSKALYEIKCDNHSKKEIVKKVLKIYEKYST